MSTIVEFIDRAIKLGQTAQNKLSGKKLQQFLKEVDSYPALADLKKDVRVSIII